MFFWGFSFFMCRQRKKNSGYPSLFRAVTRLDKSSEVENLMNLIVQQFIDAGLIFKNLKLHGFIIFGQSDIKTSIVSFTVIDYLGKI